MMNSRIGKRAWVRKVTSAGGSAAFHKTCNATRRSRANIKWSYRFGDRANGRSIITNSIIARAARSARLDVAITDAAWCVNQSVLLSRNVPRQGLILRGNPVKVPHAAVLF